MHVRKPHRSFGSVSCAMLFSLAIAAGAAPAAAAEPQAPSPTAKMSGPVAHVLRFNDGKGGSLVLRAPGDYAWARIEGTRANATTARTLTLACPERRTLSSPMKFRCIFSSNDHRPGDALAGLILRQGTAEASLTLNGAKGSLLLFLGTANVTDTKTGRSYKEAPRFIRLTQTS